MATETPTKPKPQQVTGVPDSEISYDQAKEEQGDGGNTPTPAEVKAQTEDVIDTLKPQAATKTWKIGNEEFNREYIQEPLSFIKKMQWFALVGEVLDSAMAGEDGLSVNNLFSAPSARSGQLSVSDFRDADTFIQAVGKLLTKAPDFLVKSYCIWLNVPEYEQDIIVQFMALPKHQGGLSDEDGIEIIETFIDQNYEALDRFFREELRRLQDRVQKKAEALQDKSQQSKR